MAAAATARLTRPGSTNVMPSAEWTLDSERGVSSPSVIATTVRVDYTPSSDSHGLFVLGKQT